MSDPYSLSAATVTLDRLAVATERHHTRLEELRTSRTYAEPYRRELITAERAGFEAELRRSRDTVTGILESTVARAGQRLTQPADEATEARKARAVVRVSRLLDAGKSVADALHTFAGDLDALRALRDEVPSFLAATNPKGREAPTPTEVDQVVLSVDAVMAPLLSGEEASAANARLNAEKIRSQLHTVSEHAMNPTPANRLRLGYAMSEPATA